MISNRDIIVAENEIGENNPELSLKVYSRRKAEKGDILSIHSNYVITKDLTRNKTFRDR
jgi:hypothetical protein